MHVLQTTLQKVEQDPDLGEDNPAVSDFKRMVLNRVAEMEEPAALTGKPAQMSALGTAVNLAAALVTEPKKGSVKGNLDPVLDSSFDPANNPALASAEVTPLLADAAATDPRTSMETRQIEGEL